MDRDYLVSVALYIIEGHTVKETASYFGKSVSSIKKYLATLRKSATLEDKVLMEKLNLRLKANELEGKRQGGRISKAPKSYEEFTARMYAEAYLSGFTYEELSEISHIPTSTLHDMIRGINDKYLQEEIDDYIRGGR